MRVFLLITELVTTEPGDELMFKAVNPKLDVPSMEDNVLKMWTKQGIFKKTVDQRQGKPEYVF